MRTLQLSLILAFNISIGFAQQNTTQSESDRVKLEHAQIGIVEDNSTNYKTTTHPDAQWFADAGFGMFIHWSISSIRETDLSWPMMAGTQIGWSANKPTQDSIDRFVQQGDFFAGHVCKTTNTCITPNEYWEQARFFNPTQYDPETWAKQAKAAGMKYMVFTTRHHDGFAMWPSDYGNFSTKNYMGGKDLVKPYVDACRKYGLKVGLYYSGPDWFFNKDFQSFMYYGVSRDYKNIPSVDADLKARKTLKTDAENQAHYDAMAVYLSGQIEELLTNYGKIDMIWFDGAPAIPKGNPAWEKCITMKQLHELQPGIVVSPRFYGYGDYKTYEGDAKLPTDIQKQWAELCVTVAKKGWGFTQSLIKSMDYVLSQLILSRSRNVNYLLNFGPNKEGVFSQGMNDVLNSLANWMKVNGSSLDKVSSLNDQETATVPATMKGKHRFLFIMPENKAEIIKFNSNEKVRKITVLADKQNVNFSAENGVVSISISAINRTNIADVLDIEVK